MKTNWFMENVDVAKHHGADVLLVTPVASLRQSSLVREVDNDPSRSFAVTSDGKLTIVKLPPEKPYVLFSTPGVKGLATHFLSTLGEFQRFVERLPYGAEIHEPRTGVWLRVTGTNNFGAALIYESAKGNRNGNV